MDNNISLHKGRRALWSYSWIGRLAFLQKPKKFAKIYINLAFFTQQVVQLLKLLAKDRFLPHFASFFRLPDPLFDQGKNKRQ